MIDTILSFDFTSKMGLLLYWLPLTFCVFGYIVRTWINYQGDIVARAQAELNKSSGEGSIYYQPKDTIGVLIGRGIVSVIPISNLFAAVFDVAPSIFGKFFHWIGVVFDQPLVPRRHE